MKSKKSKNLEGILIQGRKYYSTRQILNLFDLEPERFRKWIESKFIIPDLPAGGTGSTHFFLKEHLYIIRLFMKLVDAGLNRRISKDLAYWTSLATWADISYLKEPLYLIVRGDVNPKKNKNWKKYMKIDVLSKPILDLTKLEKETGFEVVIIVNLSKITEYVDSNLAE